MPNIHSYYLFISNGVVLVVDLSWSRFYWALSTDRQQAARLAPYQHTYMHLYAVSIYLTT